MAEGTINVLITSFPGLGLPQTLSLPTPRTTSIAQLWRSLNDRLPTTSHRLILSTLSNKQLAHSSPRIISDFLPASHDVLSLRLSVPVLGGKGGFGSQLRAAGGRMSSKRRKNQAENNGSSRNLDGRRLRTINEAKVLAEYLAIKPEMERKEKQVRRERWEEIVQMAEKKEEELKHGSKARLDGKWVEAKEEAGERTRDAVLAAMKTGSFKDNLVGTATGSHSVSTGNVAHARDDGAAAASSSGATTPTSETERREPKNKRRTFAGFDEDDEFMSSDEEGDA